MTDIRCERCELLVGMGCACSPARAARRAGRTPAGKVTVGRGGRRPYRAPAPRDEALGYEDDLAGVDEYRAELRDMDERGTSVRAFSGGLPTLGRRR